MNEIGDGPFKTAIIAENKGIVYEEYTRYTRNPGDDHLTKYTVTRNWTGSDDYIDSMTSTPLCFPKQDIS